MKKGIILLTIASILLSLLSFNAFADDINISKNIMMNKDIYFADDIASAYKQYETTGVKNTILRDVLKPTSMDIRFPNIDVSKVVSDVKLKELAQKDVFIQALQDHGNSILNAEEMTYSEYCNIESKWLLESDIIDSIKGHYQELENIDMSKWTHGMYQEYYKEKNKEDLRARFTNEQLAKLDRRGILVEDTLYLLKEFHDPENLLQQSDSVLKLMIEDCYKFNFSMTVGKINNSENLNI